MFILKKKCHIDWMKEKCWQQWHECNVKKKKGGKKKNKKKK